MLASSPNPTLYVQNLNEKLNKHELKRQLLLLFSQHGRVVDLVCMRTPKMRGQAHVVYQDIPQSTSALRALQGFMFFGKPIRIMFAKGMSKPLQVDEVSRKRAAEDFEEEHKVKMARVGIKEIEQMQSMEVDEEVEEDQTDVDTSENPPHKILFVKNIPTDANADMLKHLFQQYAGFVELRSVPSKPDMAFVEFKTAQAAMSARGVVDKFNITSTAALDVTYAKQ